MVALFTVGCEIKRGDGMGQAGDGHVLSVRSEGVCNFDRSGQNFDRSGQILGGDVKALSVR